MPSKKEKTTSMGKDRTPISSIGMIREGNSEGLRNPYFSVSRHRYANSPMFFDTSVSVFFNNMIVFSPSFCHSEYIQTPQTLRVRG
jgi:hypothetical protein